MAPRHRQLLKCVLVLALCALAPSLAEAKKKKSVAAVRAMPQVPAPAPMPVAMQRNGRGLLAGAFPGAVKRIAARPSFARNHKKCIASTPRDDESDASVPLPRAPCPVAGDDTGALPAGCHAPPAPHGTYGADCVFCVFGTAEAEPDLEQPLMTKVAPAAQVATTQEQQPLATQQPVEPQQPAPQQPAPQQPAPQQPAPQQPAQQQPMQQQAAPPAPQEPAQEQPEEPMEGAAAPAPAAEEETEEEDASRPAKAWGQCGGTAPSAEANQTWAGAKTCVEGATCVHLSPTYSQVRARAAARVSAHCRP
jgi:hypothetical protein